MALQTAALASPHSTRLRQPGAHLPPPPPVVSCCRPHLHNDICAGVRAWTHVGSLGLTCPQTGGTPSLGRIQAGCACFHTSPLWPHPSTHWTRHIPAGLCLAIPSGAGALTDISVLTHARRRVRRLKYDGQRGRGRRDGHRRLLRRHFRSRADHRLRMRVMTVKSAVLAGGSVCASTLCPWV